MTREEMIDTLMAQVEDWDLDTLISYAKVAELEELSKLTDDQLRKLLEDG